MCNLQQKAAHTAKRAGLLSGGLLLCMIGTGFLTVAAWLALVPLVGLNLTALILAGAYLGVGLICIGLGKESGHNTKQVPPEPQAQSSDSPPIVQAFLYGLNAGSHAERARR